MKPRVLIVRGQRFGRWLVMRETTPTSGPVTRRRLVVRCVCGRESIVVLGNLTSGHSTGCASRRCQNEHGLRRIAA
jgi:hypothetical protein